MWTWGIALWPDGKNALHSEWSIQLHFKKIKVGSSP